MATKPTKTKIQIQLGKAIRDKRLELKYSQEEFADKCKVHRTYIGGIERGERNISMKHLIGIAKALKIKASELLILANL